MLDAWRTGGPITGRAPRSGPERRRVVVRAGSGATRGPGSRPAVSCAAGVDAGRPRIHAAISAARTPDSRRPSGGKRGAGGVDAGQAVPRRCVTCSGPRMSTTACSAGPRIWAPKGRVHPLATRVALDYGSCARRPAAVGRSAPHRQRPRLCPRPGHGGFKRRSMRASRPSWAGGCWWCST